MKFVKVKKHLIILILIFLVLPQLSFAFIDLRGLVSSALGALTGILVNITESIAGVMFAILNLILGVLTPAISGFFDFLAKVAALVINNFLTVDIFRGDSLAAVLWETFKNIAYVVLIFLSLLAGFQFILNRDDQARRMIIGIIIVALLINFTFLLAREFSRAMIYITINLLKTIHPDASSVTDIGQSHFGNILYTSLHILTVEGAQKQIDIAKANLPNFSGQSLAATKMAQETVLVASSLFIIFFNAVTSLIMWVIAGISIGRYIILSFLVGVLPIVCIAYTLPSRSDYFRKWWDYFLNFNIAIPVLIVLIIIGIGLTVAIGKSLPFIDRTDPEKFHGGVEVFGRNNIEHIIFILDYLMRLLFLVAYYVGVIIISFRLGGSAASYSYKTFAWITTKTGGMVEGFTRKYGGDILGRGLEKLGDRWVGNTTPYIGGLLRKSGRVLKSAGEKLKEKREGVIKEDVEGIWDKVKNKSPDEIIDRGLSLKGDHFRAFVELMARDLDAGTLWYIYNNHRFRERLQKDKSALRKFSRGLKDIPALLEEARDLKNKGNHEEASRLISKAQSNFASSNLSGKMGIEELIKLYEGLGFNEDERKELARDHILNMSSRQRNNLITYNTPQKLREALGPERYAPLAGFVENTPIYRAFIGEMNETLRQQLPDYFSEKERNELIERLAARYAQGYSEAQLNQELANYFQERRDRITQEIQELDNQRARIENEANNKLRQIEKEINELQQQLNLEENSGAPDPSKTSQLRSDINQKQETASQIQQQYQQQINELEEKRERLEQISNNLSQDLPRAQGAFSQAMKRHQEVAAKFSPEAAQAQTETQR